ncbi:MAG: DUF2269 domain-containing protein [Chloroflexi bacterium]|nr:DUF2269 domain-containing protein [Chloroflexota bacterium]
MPDPFLLLKTLHVLAAMVAVGANVTYAFWLARAGRDQKRLVFAIDTIRWLDRSIANPGYILLAITGVLLVLTSGGTFSFTTGWIALSIVLYIGVAILGLVAFAPSIRRQLVEAERDPGSNAYATAAARSNGFGLLTTTIVLIIVTLMVTKPF